MTMSGPGTYQSCSGTSLAQGIRFDRMSDGPLEFASRVDRTTHIVDGVTGFGGDL